MALDPSIALGVKLPQIEGPAQQYQNMLALQNAQRQSQVGELQYRNMLRDQQKQDAFSQDVQGADINTPEGMKRVQAAYLKMGNPKAAAELITADLDRRFKLGQLDKQTLETDAIRVGQLSAGLAPLAAQIQQGKPVSHEQVFEIGNRLEASGLLPKGWQQSIPQNAMQLPSYIQGVVNQTEVGRKALEPFLPKPQAVGGDILNFAPQSPDFLKSLGKVSQTAGERETARHNPIMEGLARGNLNVAQTRLRNEFDPQIQAKLAGAKEGGKLAGEASAKAAIELPKRIADVAQVSNIVKQMIGDAVVDSKGKVVVPKGGQSPHPGFQESVGANYKPFFDIIPGTDKADFYALKDQITSNAFLQAYQDSLKGGGAITEVEGTKGTQALLRARTAQSEVEFIKAMREFDAANQRIVQQTKARAGAGAAVKSPAGWKVEVEK